MTMQFNEFPEFVPDQLLMSDHLNQVFDYLDEQERMTRACLIGVGIVCGLEVKTNSSGTAITITEGCGITTEGYLIQVPEMTYTERVDYDPVKARYYDRFVDIGTKTKKFDLYELVQSGVVEQSVPLTDAFIADKVVLLFVELLEEQSKNCDPNSCDDKGIEVTVTFRPLLVSKADAAALKAGAGAGTKLSGDLLNLSELRMPRVDVPATALVDSAAVFEAFLAPFTEQFLKTVQDNLSKTYTALKDLVVDVYPTNPFEGLKENFKFLITRSMTAAQLINTQYYYDLFSDLLLSYEELRRAASCVAGVCCPEDDFPRHLLLGEAKGYSQYVHSDYRHYFIPSPILAKQPCALAGLRSLEIRLALLVSDFDVPAAKKSSGKLVPDFVGITPCTLGDVPLSKKAIPYYYAVAKTPNPLYTYWDRAKTQAGAADRNLSYNASEYSSDDMIVKPLLYDLEPYNFLRIEGHIGQSYTDSLTSIQQQRNKNRLPIEVIALSTDTRGLLAELSESSAKDLMTITRAGCHFRDLESLYAALVKHLICFLCKEMKYYYVLPNSDKTPGAATLVPKVTLLQKCDPSFRYSQNTYGQVFEEWFGGMKDVPYFPAKSIFAASGYETYKMMFSSIPAPTTGGGLVVEHAAAHEAAGTVEMPIEVLSAFHKQSIEFILYYIERLSETLAASLAELDIETFAARFGDLQDAAKSYKGALVGQAKDALTIDTAELIDHLQKLIYACDLSEFRSLVAEFEKRWRAIEALRHLAYYAKKCPGLQHKAGVPMGGTFVLVYHENAASDASPDKLKKGAEGDKILEELAGKLGGKNEKMDKVIKDIADGTVIADFYFPFICCSDCPPIHFEIGNGSQAQPESPKISVTPTEFCNDDPGPIVITVSPAGGTVAGEGASGTSFIPENVDVGDISKDVELTYTTPGGTASTKVKVYHKATADFKVIQSAGAPHVDVAYASPFGASYNWDFGDGSAAVTTKNASHDYKESGSYVITLTVNNGTCSAQKTATVKVQLQRACLPVKTLADEYKALPQLDSANFAAFRKQVPGIADIDALFKDLAAAGNLSQVDEIKFHVDHKTASSLATWLRQVFVVILEHGQTRLLGLELYRILTGLAMRVACFQDEDIGDAKVPTKAVFNVITSEVAQWKNVAANTAPAAKERIKLLDSDVHKELDRLQSDEKSDKPNYLEALKAVTTTLDAYPF